MTRAEGCFTVFGRWSNAGDVHVRQEKRRRALRDFGPVHPACGISRNAFIKFTTEEKRYLLKNEVRKLNKNHDPSGTMYLAVV